MHGLMSTLARHDDITAISLLDDEFDSEECLRAMGEYCREVILVPNPNGRDGMTKRLLQLRSLASAHSFERHRYTVPALQETLDRLLQRERFDVVNVEFPYLAHLRFKQSPPSTAAPRLVIDSHEIAYELVRQFASGASGPGRRLYARLDWPKLRREEVAAYSAADGICACSAIDAERIRSEVPGARTVVIPNAADVDFYQPRPSDPPPDGRTVVFFGLMTTIPNLDGVHWFMSEIWPRIKARRPNACCKIIGSRPPPSVLDLAGPHVMVPGFVEDLRPHLASAAAIVVPLRLGGGTRLKVVEGMAMRKAIVSTTLGAEGIEAVAGRDLLIADQPEDFAASVIRFLEDPGLALRVGDAARHLAVERYAWSGAASTLDDFYRRILARRAAA
jgi:glycosyltransferase involved in cell wall biosynthesis